MRLTTHQIEFIRQLVTQMFGRSAQVRVFGSRLDAVDNPAMLAAKLSAKVSRRMNGRKVDVLISAPNLKMLPIHEVAHREGKLL